MLTPICVSEELGNDTPGDEHNSDSGILDDTPDLGVQSLTGDAMDMDPNETFGAFSISCARRHRL